MVQGDQWPQRVLIVEGIETEHVSLPKRQHRYITLLEEIRVPLTVAAEAFGTHTYVLESVTDALGNLDTYLPLRRLQSMETHLSSLTLKLVALSVFLIAPLWLSRVAGPKDLLLFSSVPMLL